MYTAPTGSPRFGDIFAADWLFDAYLRGDAVPLKLIQMSGGTDAYAPARPANDRDHVLAHGQPCTAILLADDCEVETMLRRGPRSRLLFAGIAPWPVSPSEAERVRASIAFRRHPLPPGDGFSGGIVEFQQLFAVSVEALTAGSDREPRLSRLTDDARTDLEIRWVAFATRRGPRTHLDNAEKLAQLIAANGDPSALSRFATGAAAVPAPVRAAALALADVLGLAWQIEGALLNEVAEGYERAERPQDHQNNLAEALRQLSATAAKVADAVAPARPR